MSKNNIDYRGARGSKKLCALGYHAQWDIVRDDILVFQEICVICGRKESYLKNSGGVSQLNDRIRDRENHKAYLIQPFYPDGTPNPLFDELYGDPVKLTKQDPVEETPFRPEDFFPAGGDDFIKG